MTRRRGWLLPSKRMAADGLRKGSGQRAPPPAWATTRRPRMSKSPATPRAAPRRAARARRGVDRAAAPLRRLAGIPECSPAAACLFAAYLDRRVSSVRLVRRLLSATCRRRPASSPCCLTEMPLRLDSRNGRQHGRARSRCPASSAAGARGSDLRRLGRRDGASACSPMRVREAQARARPRRRLTKPAYRCRFG